MAKQSIDDLIKKRDQLNARIKDMQAREQAKNRKARNHAMMVFGGLLENACGGDWTAIDYRALDSIVYECTERLMASRTQDGRSVDDATADLRSFEAWKRDMGKAKAATREDASAEGQEV
ncbi:MAG: hypothetical protein ACLTS9_11540 [Sutterella wadsworthensis]